MGPNNNRIAKQYLHEIRKSLPISRKHVSRLMDIFQKGVYEYSSNCQNLTIEDIYHEFGTINEVHDSIFEELPTECVVKNYRYRRTWLAIGAALCFTALVSLAIITYYHTVSVA